MKSSFDTYKPKDTRTYLSDVIDNGKTLWLRELNPDKWIDKLLRWGFLFFGVPAIAFFGYIAGPGLPTGAVLSSILLGALGLYLFYKSFKSVANGKNPIYVTESEIKFGRSKLYIEEIEKLYTGGNPYGLIATMKNGKNVMISGENSFNYLNEIKSFLPPSSTIIAKQKYD